MILSSVSLLNATPLKCISMTNQKYKERPKIFIKKLWQLLANH